LHPRDLYLRMLSISQLTPNFKYKTIKIFILHKGNQQQYTVNHHAYSLGLYQRW